MQVILRWANKLWKWADAHLLSLIAANLVNLFATHFSVFKDRSEALGQEVLEHNCSNLQLCSFLLLSLSDDTAAHVT